MRQSIESIRGMLRAAIKREDQTIRLLTGDTNPQVIELINTAKGAAGAYRACLDALQGNALILKIDAGM